MEDEKIIDLNENDLKQLYEEKYGEVTNSLDHSTLKFQANLTSPTTPSISFIYNDNDVEQNAETTLSERFIIENIDNTEIVFDESNVTIVINDDSDFKKLFEIEEKEIEND